MKKFLKTLGKVILTWIILLFTLPLLGIIFPFISNRNLQVDIMMWGLLLVPLYFFLKAYFSLSVFIQKFKNSFNNNGTQKVIEIKQRTGTSKFLYTLIKAIILTVLFFLLSLFFVEIVPRLVFGIFLLLGILLIPIAIFLRSYFEQIRNFLQIKNKPANEIFVGFIHTLTLTIFSFIYNIFIIFPVLIYYIISINNISEFDLFKDTSVLGITISAFWLLINILAAFMGHLGTKLFVISWLIIIISVLGLILIYIYSTKFVNSRYLIKNKNKVIIYSTIFGFTIALLHIPTFYSLFILSVSPIIFISATYISLNVSKFFYVIILISVFTLLLYFANRKYIKNSTLELTQAEPLEQNQNF
jgi:hypothetical protein